MRQNHNGRHMRGGRRGNGGGHHHNSGNSGHNGGQHRRVNPRVQTFDSNGPEVRIRGNAFQINEKYLALARDAASAGDRILAESYFQHAEHYQRMINEMNEEYARQNPQAAYQQQQQQPYDGQQQPAADGNLAAQPQPVVENGGMEDLDQGFLVGPRGNGHANGHAVAGTGEQPAVPGDGPQPEQPQQDGRHQQRRQFRQRESGTV